MSISQAVILLAVLGGIGVKAKLHVYIEDVFVKHLSPEYFNVENSEIYIVETSSLETTVSMNFTIIKELPPGFEGHFKLLGLSMGKYDLSTGLDVTMDGCEMVADPIIFGPVLATLGITSENCPPEPGTYAQEGLQPTMDNFPDDFPENKYLAIMEARFEEDVLVVVHVILDVQL